MDGWVMRGVVVVQQLSVSCGVVVVQMPAVVFVQGRREMWVSGFMSCGTGLGGFGERHGNGCVQIDIPISIDCGRGVLLFPVLGKVTRRFDLDVDVDMDGCGS